MPILKAEILCLDEIFSLAESQHPEPLLYGVTRMDGSLVAPEEQVRSTAFCALDRGGKATRADLSAFPKMLKY
jgi:hypothetical protein